MAEGLTEREQVDQVNMMIEIMRLQAQGRQNICRGSTANQRGSAMPQDSVESARWMNKEDIRQAS